MSKTGHSDVAPTKKGKKKRRKGASLAPPRSTPPSSLTRERIEASCRIGTIEPLAAALTERVVGQDQAIDSLLCAFSRLLSGLHDPSRPLLTALLLGPTGVGKTETARALAEALFGSERAMVRVNCEEYVHGHEISKLLGSPPGYVGSQIEPLLSQRRIDEAHRGLREEWIAFPGEIPGIAERLFGNEGDRYVSVVLFDEIEKAHPVVWDALLGILEDGMLTLGNNTTTDFTRSIILMTSNVGSREMGEVLERRPVGFHADPEAEKPTEAEIVDTALASVTEVFPYEFLNRFDEVLVYSPLGRQELDRIFDKFLADVHARTVRQAQVPLVIRVSDEARALIVDLGTDPRFGARPLRRAIERLLVDQLSRFIAASRLRPGDIVDVEVANGELAFYRISKDEGLVASPHLSTLEGEPRAIHAAIEAPRRPNRSG